MKKRGLAWEMWLVLIVLIIIIIIVITFLSDKVLP